jgi:hypothetical protein
MESVLPCAAAERPEPGGRLRFRDTRASLTADTAEVPRAVFFAGTGELLRGRPRLVGDFRAVDFLASAIRDAILQIRCVLPSTTNRVGTNRINSEFGDETVAMLATLACAGCAAWANGTLRLLLPEQVRRRARAVTAPACGRARWGHLSGG